MEIISLQNELLSCIRRGESKAIKDLYKSAFGYCASFVLNNKGSKEDATEFFQRAMVVLIEKLKDENFTIKYNIKSFLYAITRNQWLNELKRTGKLTGIVDEEGKELPLQSEDENEIAEKQKKESQFQELYKIMKNASEECQKLLKLTFFEKKKDKEIAPILKYTLEFVRNKRRRCIAGMRKQIGVIK